MPHKADNLELDHLTRHAEGVRRLARSLVRDTDLAEDVAQEALLAALERPPPPSWNLRAWLFGVVRNRARRAYRDGARRRSRERSVARPGSVPSAAELTIRITQQKRLLDAVLSLPEKYKTAVWLRYFDDLPPRAIAVRVGRPVETVRTRIRRAIVLLRDDLDSAHGGDRRAWVATLTPLAAGSGTTPALPLLGGLLMATGGKTGLVVASAMVFLALAGAGLWLVAGRSTTDPSPIEQSAARDGEGMRDLSGGPDPHLRGRPLDANEPVARSATDSSVSEARTADKGREGPIPAASRVLDRGAVEPGIIAGRVVDAQGRPLAYANLLVMSDDRAIGSKSAQTDASGEFRLQDLGARTVTMLARRPGSASVAKRVDPGTRVRVVLMPGTPIEGVVVDAEDGRPVAGVRVETCEVRLPTASWTRRDLTRQDGHFTLTDLAHGTYDLEFIPPWVRHSSDGIQYVRLRVPAVRTGTAALEVELERGFSIAGVVRDSMKDPPGVRVGVLLSPVSGPVDHHPGTRFVRSDLEGGFAFRGLPRGLYDLEFTPELRGEASDMRRGPVRLERVPAGSEGLFVQLSEGRSLEGRILDDAGEPVTAGGTISVVPAHRGAPGGDSSTAEILPGGRFRTVPLTSGVRYDLVASRFPGFLPATARGVLADDGEVLLVLQRGGRISGVVVAEDGRPAPAGIPVAALLSEDLGDPRLSHGSTAHALTGEAGRFTLQGLRPRLYRVLAGGGTSPFVSLRAEPSVRPSAKNLVLAVRRGVPFRGRLTDAHGLPVASEFVQARSTAPDESASHWTTAGPDGRFLFPGVPEGEVQLLVKLADGPRLLGTFTAPADEVEVCISK